MAVQITTTVGPYDQRYYEQTLIDSAKQELYHAVPLEKYTLPKKMGKVINWREFEVFSAVTTALTESVSPAISAYTTREVTATVAQYAATHGFSDMVDFTKPDKHGTQIVQNQGYQAGLSADTLTRNAILPNATNDYYGSAAGTLVTTVGSTAAPIDGIMLDKVHTNMRNNNCPYFTKVMGGSPNTNTTPVEPCYLAIVHPSVGYTLRGISGFRYFSEYGNPGKRMNGEIGAYKNIRFLETTNAYVNAGAGAGSADVYYTGIFGPKSGAVVELDGMSLTTYYDPPGSGEDRARQRHYYTWKFSHAAAILNNAFMAILGNTIESI